MPRCTIVLALVVALPLSGCHTWQVVDHRSRLDVEETIDEGKAVRVTRGEERETLRVTRVLYPFIDGERLKPEAGAGEAVSVNLRRIDLLEVRADSPGPWLAPPVVPLGIEMLIIGLAIQ